MARERTDAGDTNAVQGAPHQATSTYSSDVVRGTIDSSINDNSSEGVRGTIDSSINDKAMLRSSTKLLESAAELLAEDGIAGSSDASKRKTERDMSESSSQARGTIDSSINDNSSEGVRGTIDSLINDKAMLRSSTKLLESAAELLSEDGIAGSSDASKRKTEREMSESSTHIQNWAEEVRNAQSTSSDGEIMESTAQTNDIQRKQNTGARDITSAKGSNPHESPRAALAQPVSGVLSQQGGFSVGPVSVDPLSASKGPPRGKISGASFFGQRPQYKSILRRTGVRNDKLQRVRFDMSESLQHMKKTHRFGRLIQPASSMLQWWHTAMLLPLSYEMWGFAFRLALSTPLSSRPTWGYVDIIDLLVDAFFVCDGAMQLNTVPVEHSEKENNGQRTSPYISTDEVLMLRVQIARRYLTRAFPVELLPSVLFWVVSAWKQCPISVWWGAMLLRAVPRSMRLSAYFQEIATNLSIEIFYLQIFKFALYIFMSTHYIGCLFYWLAINNNADQVDVCARERLFVHLFQRGTVHTEYISK